MRLAQQNYITSLKEECQRQMLTAAHTLALDSKNLLDAVDQARVRANLAKPKPASPDEDDSGEWRQSKFSVDRMDLKLRLNFKLIRLWMLNRCNNIFVFSSKEICHVNWAFLEVETMTMYNSNYTVLFLVFLLFLKLKIMRFCIFCFVVFFHLCH